MVQTRNTAFDRQRGGGMPPALPWIRHCARLPKAMLLTKKKRKFSSVC